MISPSHKIDGDKQEERSRVVELRLIRMPSPWPEPRRDISWTLAVGASIALHVLFAAGLLFLKAPAFLFPADRHEVLVIDVTYTPHEEVGSSTQDTSPPASQITPVSPVVAPPKENIERKVAKQKPVAPSSSSGSSVKAAESDATNPAAASSQPGVSRIGGRYEDVVVSKLMRVRNYPERARRRGIEGDGVLSLVLSSDGKVRSVDVAKTTDSEILDQEMTQMVSKAAPFPPAPHSPIGSEIKLIIPVRFSLTE